MEITRKENMTSTENIRKEYKETDCSLSKRK